MQLAVFVLLFILLCSSQYQYSAKESNDSPSSEVQYIPTIDVFGSFATIVSVIWAATKMGLSRDTVEAVAKDLVIIKDKLDDIQRGIEGIKHDIDDLARKTKSFHDMTRNVAAFGKSLNRLNAFRRQAKMLQKDKHGLMLSTYYNNRWADMILSFHDDGVLQVISDIDCMIRGCNRLVGKSILFKYIDVLPESIGNELWHYIGNMQKYLVETQVEAYMYLIKALDLKNRTADKVRYFEEFKKSFKVQNEQVYKIVNDDRIRFWPKGKFSVPYVAKSRCPIVGNSSWPNEYKVGYRHHDTEDTNNKNYASVPYGIAGYWRKNIKIYFCTRTTYHSSNPVKYWPRGSYCFFKYGSCPSGMSATYVNLADEHDRNENSAAGVIPEGEVGRKESLSSDWKYPEYKIVSYYSYCCRNNGNEKLVLPITKPFYLLPYRGKSCPEVAHMRVRKEWLKFDGDNGWKKNQPGWTRPTLYQLKCSEVLYWGGPQVTQGGPSLSACLDVTMHFCYYERNNF